MLQKNTYRLCVETMVLGCCLFRSKKDNGNGEPVDDDYDSDGEESVENV